MASTFSNATRVDHRISGIVEVLHCLEPAQDYSEKMQLYAWLVGSWEKDVLIHKQAGCGPQKPRRAAFRIDVTLLHPDDLEAIASFSRFGILLIAKRFRPYRILANHRWGREHFAVSLYHPPQGSASFHSFPYTTEPEPNVADSAY
jgi:hypothetical protein